MNVTDTVHAFVSQPLVVEIHDSTGAIAPPGTYVWFTSGNAPSGRAEAYVKALTSTTSYPSYAMPIDQAGRASVLVQLASVAGPGQIVVTVPTMGLADTVRFTVLPGAAYQALVSPRDTALYVGKSFTLRGGIADFYKNPRSDPVTWSATGAGITVSSGGLVTASAVGRNSVTATGAMGAATGAVSVVPQGELAVWDSGFVTTVNLDGSGKTALTLAIDLGKGVHPAWIPGTNTVVYTTVTTQGYATIWTVGPNGNKPFLASSPPNIVAAADPTPSADGKWLYFSAIDANDTRCSWGIFCISRAKIDGSAPELLVTTPSRYPAPSPDGSKVAYVSSGVIQVLDVATKITSAWSVPGTAPAWSPDGRQITYMDSTGLLSFINPDGTGARTLTPAVYVTAPISWSPDGKWVVARTSSGTVTLIDQATGVTLPLPYTVFSSAPSVK